MNSEQIFMLMLSIFNWCKEMLPQPMVIVPFFEQDESDLIGCNLIATTKETAVAILCMYHFMHKYPDEAIKILEKFECADYVEVMKELMKSAENTEESSQKIEIDLDKDEDNNSNVMEDYFNTL